MISLVKKDDFAHNSSYASLILSFP